MMEKEFKSILFLKLPYCTHPNSASDDNFRIKRPFRPIPSLALAVLCGFVEKYKTFDYGIKAIDLNIKAYTKPGIPIDTSVYPSLLEDTIINNNYDVLALSAMFVFNEKWVDEAVKLSKKFHPEAKIIIGGGYPTLFPERCLEKHGIDEAVIGEGEATFLHILNKYNNYKDAEFEQKFPSGPYASRNENGQIAIIGERHNFINLADLPVPAWDYLGIKEYFEKSGDKTLPIEGTRGCPYRCSYCCTFISWGNRIRYKPVENLIKEILELKENNPQVESLFFVDDNLSFSKEWITDFLTKIIDMNLPLKIDITNLSVKHIDEDIIKLLKKAGMNLFAIAIETGSPEMQRRINKNLVFDKVRETIKMMKANDVQIHICWMIGFPNETMAQINETFNLARELKAFSNQFLTVLPYPGTQLFNEAKKDNLLVFSEDDLDKFDNRQCDYLKSDEWNYKQLQEMIYDVNIETNFLCNPYLDGAQKQDIFLDYCEKLLLSLPEHIILHLVAGYILKQKNRYAEHEKHYNAASELLKNKRLAETFAKYLSWDNPIIKDFNNFIKM